MSLLRIRISLTGAAGPCQWVLINHDQVPICGTGTLQALPDHRGRVQLVIPAAQVLITRVNLPRSARRQTGALLGYAVEETLVGEPDNEQVSWLGTCGEMDVLAVIAKASLKPWLEALAAAGVSEPEIHVETLLIPWTPGQWSLVWDGHEGILRSGKFEGMATDRADPPSPPLALRLLLDEAKTRGELPQSIALYTSAEGVMPDMEAWQRNLGIPLHAAGAWRWQDASPRAGVRLARQQHPWRLSALTLARLKPAAWALAAVFTLHGSALFIDRMLLSVEQGHLRKNMAARFRSTFPEALAVVDPSLQMRRKLAEANHEVGQSDPADFLPMVEQIAIAIKEVPGPTVRRIAYQSGRVTLELTTTNQVNLKRILSRLVAAGLSASIAPALTPTGSDTSGETIVLNVESS